MTKKDVDVNELPRFTDIKDEALRDKNRGAILANIYETYSKSEDQLLHYLSTYLDRLPESEREVATFFMTIHLKQRGYTIGS